MGGATEAVHKTCFSATRPPKIATLFSFVTYLEIEIKTIKLNERKFEYGYHKHV
jgi:hypothetical protein